MKIEKSRIAFGNRSIDFFVKRSKRYKTISIFVDPFEGIFLRAPFGPSIESLSRLVHSKAIWILKKQKQIEETKGFVPKKEFVGGETFFYLGRQLRLKVIGTNSESKTKVKVSQGKFVVSFNSHYTEIGRKRVVRKALINWYRKHARNILLNRSTVYSKKLNLRFPEVLLANQSKRWGSCNHRGKIRFNWHIIMAPMSLIDYVVAHEFCHLKHTNHSKDFWQLLGSVMPDYEFRRERLRKEGIKYIL